MKTIWKIPAYCFAAGLVCYWITVRLGGYFFGQQIDNYVSVNRIRALLFYGLLFMLTLLIGAFLFRAMTRRQRLHSALVAVGLYLAFTLIGLTGSAGLLRLSLLLDSLDEWCTFISYALFRLKLNIYIASLLQCLAPLLFVLLPTKHAE